MRFFGYVLDSVSREDLVLYSRDVRGGGVWFRTRARNRMVVFKCGLGRIEWFETGRVNCWVSKPASLGKMKQLLADGFFKTGLVFDINVFDEWVESFRLKGFHLVLDTGERLPNARIGLLKDSNGVVAVLGDKSHPTGVELRVVYPDWVERNEDLLKQNVRAFRQFSELLKGFAGLGMKNVKNGLGGDGSGMVI